MEEEVVVRGMQIVTRHQRKEIVRFLEDRIHNLNEKLRRAKEQFEGAEKQIRDLTLQLQRERTRADLAEAELKSLRS